MGLGRATPDHPAHPVSQTFEQASQDVRIFPSALYNIVNFISLIHRIVHVGCCRCGCAHAQGAHAFSVLVAAFCGDELLSDSVPTFDQCADAKVRDRKMRSPALRMSTLPGGAFTGLITSQFLRTNKQQPCARRER